MEPITSLYRLKERLNKLLLHNGVLGVYTIVPPSRLSEDIEKFELRYNLDNSDLCTSDGWNIRKSLTYRDAYLFNGSGPNDFMVYYNVKKKTWRVEYSSSEQLKRVFGRIELSDEEFDDILDASENAIDTLLFDLNVKM